MDLSERWKLLAGVRLTATTRDYENRRTVTAAQTPRTPPPRRAWGDGHLVNDRTSDASAGPRSAPTPVPTQAADAFDPQGQSLRLWAPWQSADQRLNGSLWRCLTSGKTNVLTRSPTNANYNARGRAQLEADLAGKSAPTGADGQPAYTDAEFAVRDNNPRCWASAC